jgi:hypothetical protein
MGTSIAYGPEGGSFARRYFVLGGIDEIRLIASGEWLNNPIPGAGRRDLTRNETAKYWSHRRHCGRR